MEEGRSGEIASNGNGTVTTKARKVWSYVNAGKREFGDNHWFWAVWNEVEDSKEWNQQSPSFCGYSSSKTLARRAAWEALNLGPRLPVYRTGWAWRYRDWLRDQDTRFRFSRCSIGKNRWFWIVSEDSCSDPIARGIARSPDQALAEAEQQYGSLQPMNATLAKAHWEKQQAMVSQRSVANGEEALPLQFAYRCYWDYSDYDSSEYEVIERHRIARKTKKRLFVEVEEHDQSPLSGEWWDYKRPTFVLDRRKFETTGKAVRAGRRSYHRDYYADPALFHAERRHINRPDCFEALDLPADATTADIKAAFRRLSLSTHPDTGGKAEEFVSVRRSYEQAMAIASRKEGAVDA